MTIDPDGPVIIFCSSPRILIKTVVSYAPILKMTEQEIFMV